MKFSTKQNRKGQSNRSTRTFVGMEPLEERRMMSGTALNLAVFHAPIQNYIDVFTVTNTGDNNGVNPAPGAGTGTLRQAIVDADADSSGRAITINFNIGSGLQTISVNSQLPAITRSLNINGLTSPNYGTSQTIDLHGVGVPLSFYLKTRPTYGLNVTTSGSVAIQGLSLDNFATGIKFTSTTSGLIESCNITNVYDGVILQGGSKNVVTSNTISAATDGIELLGSSQNQIGGDETQPQGLNYSNVNHITAGAAGIDLETYFSSPIANGVPSSGNHVDGNYMSGGNYGIFTDSTSSGNEFAGNNISNVNYFGILAQSSNNQIGEGPNLTFGIEALPNTINLVLQGDGIGVTNSGNFIVYNNVMNTLGSQANNTGVGIALLGATNTTVLSNDVYGNVAGIYDDQGSGNTIGKAGYANTISNNSTYGVILQSTADTASTTGNIFSSNTLGNVEEI